MKIHRFALKVVLCGTALAHFPAYAGNYFFTLMNPMSDASGVNNAGQVVGAAQTGAAVWSPGGGQRIYSHLSLFSINAAGTSAGVDFSDFRSPDVAVTASNGKVTVLPGLSNKDAGARDINNAGQVVGYAVTASGHTHATSWKNGVAADLGTLGGESSNAVAINNSGLIVGDSHYNMQGYSRATAWSNGQIIDLTPGVLLSTATDVNDNNTIVGWVNSDTIKSHAVKWDNGKVTDLGTLLGPNSTYQYNFSSAQAINNKGQIVGYSSINSYYTDTVATLWDNGQVIDLNKYISPQASADGWILQNAVGINEDGWIVGRAYRYADNKLAAFILSTRDFGAATPVPEPSTYAMLLAGLGLMGWTMRRKQIS